ncbi:MAG: kelch repeat-containing protein [Smithella sp.]
MKKFVAVVVAVVLYSFICVSMAFAAADTWTQKADFGGSTRVAAVGFSIGSKGYIGTGTADAVTPFQDFWEYDPAADTWTQKADVGGLPRMLAIGFSIGSKGYIGTGSHDLFPAAADVYKDFWEYDPTANTWTQKADFGGGNRYCATGFSIGSKGYIGTGLPYAFNPPPFNDLWEYNPATDTWTQKANVGGVGRYMATGFSIGSKGYIGGGSAGSGGNYQKDFWEYDPVTDTWTQKADSADPRIAATGFSIGNKGYMGIGAINEGANLQNDFWEYDPAVDTWTQKTDFGGTVRGFAVGFSIGSKGFIGTGAFAGNGFSNIVPYKDFWEYDPGNSCTPPVISSLTATPDTRMVPVTISAVVSDAFDPSPVTKIISVTSNDPPNSDAVANGKAVITGDLTLNLLASRLIIVGKERVYTITVQSENSCGMISTGTVTVRERSLMPRPPI